MRKISMAAAAATVVLTLAACTGVPERARGYKGSTTSTTVVGTAVGVRLVSYDACDDLLGWFRSQAEARVGPYGLDGGPEMYAVEDSAGDQMTAGAAREEATNSAEAPAPATSAGGGDSDKSAGDGSTTGTNNQEAGVDESDIVKLAGTRVLTLRGNQLVIAELASGAPVEVARVELPLGYASQMFVTGERVFVVGSSTTAADGPTAGPSDGSSDGGMTEEMSRDMAVSRSYPGTQGTSIVEVSLAGTPKVAGHVTVDGEISSGRLTDGTVRFVMTRPQPSLGFVMPSGATPEALELAERTNREVVAKSSIEHWLPARIDDAGGRTPLVACNATFRPTVDAGLGTTTVLTIPDGLTSLNATTVVTDGGITYASTGGLYVATPRWNGRIEPMPMPMPMPVEPGAGARRSDSDESTTAVAEEVGTTTQIHRFDTSTKTATTYQASGEVTGSLIGQYAMSEWKGNLRVASTASTGRAGTNEGQRSLVTVLGREGDRLVQVGQVDGLGPTEQIRGVRFDGATGYVVTFRQTDPLYVVDLSDPTKPVTRGELEVPGFSSYLHPVGEHRVLGVGSDATEQGRITGAKVSLYDTADPTAPKELATWTMQDGHFLAGDDPHAFTWEPTRRLVVLGGSGYIQGGYRSGAVVLRIDDTGIAEVGWLDHSGHVVTRPNQPSCPPGANCIEPAIEGDGDGVIPDYVSSGGPISRTMFVATGAGDRLVAVSDSGISTHDPATLTETGWLAY